MNTGTQAAREAGNMVDLDSNPTKLHRDRRDRQAAAHDARRADHVQHRQRRREVLRDPAGDVRRHLRGRCRPGPAGVARRHAAALAAQRDPERRGVQRSHHHRVDPAGPARRRAIRPASAAVVLRRNLLRYGVGGVIAPFAGIKLLDLLLTALHLV
jgi:K+-transporting ATPase ATPase B chain